MTDEKRPIRQISGNLEEFQAATDEPMRHPFQDVERQRDSRPSGLLELSREAHQSSRWN
jgi:hypothetical protein